VKGSVDLPGIADLAAGGSGPALVATVAEVTDPSAVAAKLAALIGGPAEEYEAKLADPLAGGTAVLGGPGSGDIRIAVDAAIADGSLPGIRVEEVARVAVATGDGVAFVDAPGAPWSRPSVRRRRARLAYVNDPRTCRT
jgi:hypothetical protein